MGPQATSPYHPSPSNYRIRPRQEYGSTAPEQHHHCEAGTPTRTPTIPLTPSSLHSCGSVRAVVPESGKKNSGSTSNNKENSNLNRNLHSYPVVVDPCDSININHKNPSRSMSVVASPTVKSASALAPMASPEVVAETTLQEKHPQHQKCKHQQKQRQPQQQTPKRLEQQKQTKPSRGTKPSSSKKAATPQQMVAFLKRLFVRCFMTRRRRRKRRGLATRKMKNNNFQTVDGSQEGSGSKPYGSIPCNETEMYLMLRSKRVPGGIAAPPSSQSSSARTAQRSHSNPGRVPSAGSSERTGARAPVGPSQGGRRGGYRSQPSAAATSCLPTPPPRHHRHRTMSAESHYPTTIAITRDRASTIGSVSPRLVFIEPFQEPESHLVALS